MFNPFSYFFSEKQKNEDIGLVVKNDRIEISRPAENNKEAIRQIDAISKFYNDQMDRMEKESLERKK